MQSAAEVGKDLKESSERKQGLDVFALTKADYPVLAQGIIQEYYLKPFPVEGQAVVKPNLKNGIIERETHGAMHAVRVSIYIQMFHELMKRHQGKEVDEIFTTLKETFGCEESQLMGLNQLAGIFHDCAREGEKQDRWEGESGLQFIQFLLSQVNKKTKRDPKLIALSMVYRFAVQHKDHSELFEDELRRILPQLLGEISPELIKACNYIRQLLQAGDCIDIIRCNGDFFLNRLEIYKEAAKNGLASLKADIINLARNAHALLYTQGDLLWDCKIHLNETEVIPTDKNGNHFSLKLKVPYEHATNVYLAIQRSFLQNPFFASILNNEPIVDLLEVEPPHPGFNPFLHGTNSSVLALLPKTQFQFLSPLVMMDNYQLAPMAGEISGGGLNSLADGRMCFGRLNSKNCGEYTLQRIVYGYASRPIVIPDLKELQEKLTQCIRLKLFNINTFIIELCRVRQSGADISSLNSKELLEELQLTIQFYYLTLCITDHLKPNLAAVKQHLALNAVFCGILGYSPTLGKIQRKFTEKYFKQCIKEKKLDVQAIWKNPTREGLELLCGLFEIRSDEFEAKNDKEQVTLRLFLPEKPKDFILRRGHDPNYYFQCFVNPEYKEQGLIEKILNNMFSISCLSENWSGTVAAAINLSSYDGKPHDFLKDFRALDSEKRDWLIASPSDLRGDLKALSDVPAAQFSTFNLQAIERLLAFRPQLILYLEKLENRYKTLQAILANKMPINFSAQEKEFIERPFPIVLMSEQEDVIEMVDFGSREFRARQVYDIRLGNQISLLGTDNETHQEMLEEYLRKNRLDVPVVLFSELELGINPVTERPHMIENCLKLYTQPQATETQTAPIGIIMGYLYEQYTSQGTERSVAETQLTTLSPAPRVSGSQPQ